MSPLERALLASRPASVSAAEWQGRRWFEFIMASAAKPAACYSTASRMHCRRGVALHAPTQQRGLAAAGGAHDGLRGRVGSDKQLRHSDGKQCCSHTGCVKTYQHVVRFEVAVHSLQDLPLVALHAVRRRQGLSGLKAATAQQCSRWSSCRQANRTGHHPLPQRPRTFTSVTVTVRLLHDSVAVPSCRARQELMSLRCASV